MVDIIVDEGIEEPLPDDASICRAVAAACSEAGMAGTPQLCIRFADNATVKELNSRWRGQESVTDILSFPMQAGPEFDPDESLGDMILATPFTLREAERLSLPSADHMLHLIVHATLHLLGYDHMTESEAELMQKMECSAMQKLGLHNPYPDELYKDETHV
ncbi:MAG: rRNA maturation RNase YbeY [Mariprofundaceae bacterium]|nr:rRNA maturation RNase YbeY [Mariprofundaceae bacterium]